MGHDKSNLSAVEIDVKERKRWKGEAYSSVLAAPVRNALVENRIGVGPRTVLVLPNEAQGLCFFGLTERSIVTRAGVR